MIKGSSDTKNLGGSPENKMIKFITPNSVKTDSKDEKAVELVTKEEIKPEIKAEIKENEKPKV